MIRVLNLGAGVQSTAVYLMGDFDTAIFADTGEEPEAVYKHLAWLQSLNRQPILIRSKGKLGDDMKNGRNSAGRSFASIPCFTKGDENDSRGITRRQCTGEYKIDVIERTIRREILGLKHRQRIPKGTSVEQSFGISLDEASRSRRIEERCQNRPWIKPRFPLLDKYMTRADCERWMQNFGVPHKVTKSACVFCPYHNDWEWKQLKETDPAGWNRAVEIDESLRTPGWVGNRLMNRPMYLHSSCTPLVQIDFSKAPEKSQRQYGLGFALECSGMCGI